jgi:hypothetical protein
VSQYIRGGRKARNTMSGSSLTSGNRGNSARTRPPLLVWLGQKFQGPHTSQPAAVWLFASVVAGNANAPISTEFGKSVLHVFSFFMAVLVPLDFLRNPEDTRRRLPEPPAAVSLK